MNQVDRVLAMIKRLKGPQLMELSKKLEAFPDWPGKAGTPVGAKPKTGPPTLSTEAKAERR